MRLSTLLALTIGLSGPMQAQSTGEVIGGAYRGLRTWLMVIDPNPVDPWGSQSRAATRCGISGTVVQEIESGDIDRGLYLYARCLGFALDTLVPGWLRATLAQNGMGIGGSVNRGITPLIMTLPALPDTVWISAATVADVIGDLPQNTFWIDRSVRGPLCLTCKPVLTSELVAMDSLYVAGDWAGVLSMWQAWSAR